MASPTGATDPNGWMTPGAKPGSVFVKIVGTSRETMNGQMAAVLAYQEDRGRYVVHTAKEQQQALLKPENLVKASWLEGMMGQFEMIRNHPEVKNQITQAYNAVQQSTGVKPEYVAVAVALLMIFVVYFVGFTKTLMVLSFVMLAFMVIAPDLGSPLPVIARNFPMRARAMIREQIPYVGPKIADNQYLSMAVVGLILFFFLNALIRSPPGRNAATSAATSQSAFTAPTQPHLEATTSSSKPVMDRAMLEDYYRLGFEDGQAGKEFGTSMPVPAAEPAEEERTARATGATGARDYDFDFVDNSGVPPPQAKKSGFDWTVMLSLMYLGRQVFSMGSTADGGWDYQLALANLRTMDTMRLGFFAFSVYRLVSALSRAF